MVAAMLAGATHIDHVDMLRAGATQRVLGFKVMAPSTVGTFLRSFTFGHVRRLDAVLTIIENPQSRSSKFPFTLLGSSDV